MKSISGARALPRKGAAILVAIAVGGVLLLAASWAAGRAVSRSASASSVLRLDSVDPRGAARPLTRDSIAAMRRIPGVQDVKASTQFGFSVVGDPTVSSAGAFWATPRVPWIQPRVTVAIPGIPADHVLADDEVYFPDTHPGTTTRALLGKRLTIQYTRATGPSQGEAAEATVHVIGLFDNSAPGGDGEAAVYVSDSLFQTLLAAQLGLTRGAQIPAAFAYPTVFVKASSTDQVASVQTALVRLGFNTPSLAAQTR